MKPVEMLWRKSAARSRFQMRQCALWWKDTGERHFLQAAVESRNDHRDALRIANHYAQQEVQRFKTAITAVRKECAA